MEKIFPLIQEKDIKCKIHTIRGTQVILDSDLALLYNVRTKELNKAVGRNIERFPECFRFKLTTPEIEILRFQFGTSSWGGRRNSPYAFTEQGIAMLSGILRSKIAIKVSIQIMNSFVNMRKFIKNNANIFHRLDSVEQKQLEYQIKTDNRFEEIFSAIEDKQIKQKQGIFFNGQIFDSYKFISELIRSAEKEIILIDNYIDDTVLDMFSKRNKKVKVLIYTKNITNQLKLDKKKYNSQYEEVKIVKFNDSHDRFLIIDQKEVYHVGASLKDLGKKWFAFSKLDKKFLKILNLLPK